MKEKSAAVPGENALSSMLFEPKITCRDRKRFTEKTDFPYIYFSIVKFRQKHTFIVVAG
nr:hypothetical protein Iba_chr11bCG15780 [Ipomoea batatas]